MIPTELLLGIILQASAAVCGHHGGAVGWYDTPGDGFVVRCASGYNEQQYVCDYEDAFCVCGLMVRAK